MFDLLIESSFVRTNQAESSAVDPDEDQGNPDMDPAIDLQQGSGSKNVREPIKQGQAVHRRDVFDKNERMRERVRENWI